MAVARSGSEGTIGPHPELLREGYTMALYVSIVVFAAIAAMDDADGTHDVTVVAVVLGTTVGLALAHWFAFSIAARLIGAVPEGPAPRRLLAAQMGAAALVATIAIAAVLVMPDHLEQVGAMVAIALFIAAVVFNGTRKGGEPVVRSVISSVLALVLFLAVAAAKNQLSH